MENWKNALALIGAGVIIGAVAVLILISSGAIPHEIGVGTIKFTIPAPTPKTVFVVVTATPLPTPSPTALPPEGTEVARLIDVETNATLREDINQALSLYADNAVIIDAYLGLQWVGLNQIRSRYSDTFAQSTFLEDIHKIIDLRLDKDRVTVRVRQSGKIANEKNNTVTEIQPNQQLWYFAKIDGKWKIVRLIYGMPD